MIALEFSSNISDEFSKSKNDAITTQKKSYLSNRDFNRKCINWRFQILFCDFRMPLTQLLVVGVLLTLLTVVAGAGYRKCPTECACSSDFKGRHQTVCIGGELRPFCHPIRPSPNKSQGCSTLNYVRFHFSIHCVILEFPAAIHFCGFSRARMCILAEMKIHRAETELSKCWNSGISSFQQKKIMVLNSANILQLFSYML